MKLTKLAIVLAGSLFGCFKNTPPVSYEIDSGVEYLRSRNYSNVQGDKVGFIFSNNPFLWDKDYKLIIYINNDVCYAGVYRDSGEFYIKRNKSNKIVHFKFEIIDKNTISIFENKSVLNWNDEFQYVYIALFPSNPVPYHVHFFPQKHEVIQ